MMIWQDEECIFKQQNIAYLSSIVLPENSGNQTERENIKIRKNYNKKANEKRNA